MRVTKLLLALLVASVLQASPYYLYDCSGIVAACTDLVPGNPTPRDGGIHDNPFVVGGRVIITGHDLGPAYNGISPVPTFAALYVSDEAVVGWMVHPNDHDLDGHVVKWLLGPGAPVFIDTGISGPGPGIIRDVNSAGDVIGNFGNNDRPFVNDQVFNIHMLVNPEYWESRISGFGFSGATELLRINEAGQILGTAQFWPDPAEISTANVRDTRLFLMSPTPVDFNPIPEPGDSLLVLWGLGLMVAAYLRRRQCG